MSGFLSSQAVDLNARGEIVNDVYYNRSQVVVQDCEVSTTLGRFTQSLTSLQFGSTSQITIPNQDIIHEVYLHIKLPALVANQTLPRGFCFDIIREVTYNWGASNSPNMRLSGKSIRQISMESCETKEKRGEALQLAGEAFNNPSPTVTPEGTVILPMPWSNYQGDKKKKGYDTSLLNNPITIQITLHDAGVIYGGSATPPTALAQGEVFLRQTAFQDRSNSLRMDLQNNPSMMYLYPFYHKYTPVPKYNIPLDGVTRHTITLQEFLDADLQNIIFSVHPTALQKRNGTNAPTPGVSCELLDIELLYNGQTIYKAPGASARLTPMSFYGGASGIEDVLLTQTTPWGNASIVDYVYSIPFSYAKSVNYEYKFENSPRFANQTMSLSFAARPVGGGAGVIGELHSTYIYSAYSKTMDGVCSIQLS